MTLTIDMVLHCPACGMQHIDRDEAEDFTPVGECTCAGADSLCECCLANRTLWESLWRNPPHRSHLCGGCGHVWRPADVPTNGVQAVRTRGKQDHPILAARSIAGEPIGYLSPKQLPRVRDVEDAAGSYLLMRKTRAGNFTLALYTGFPAELDVRRILLDVVPGDGSGFEVYAETVADVEKRFTEMGDRIQELESRRATHAPQPVALPDYPAMIRWLQDALRDAGKCIDGGHWHHGCKRDPKAECWRQRECAPLSGSGLDDCWQIPAGCQGCGTVSGCHASNCPIRYPAPTTDTGEKQR